MNSFWKEMIPLSSPKELFTSAWHTFVVYLFLVVMFRLFGRRQLGQVNVIDLVILILMGSAVQTAMVAGNTRLDAGLLSVGILFISNRGIAFASRRSYRFRNLLCGGPILLVQDGIVHEEHLKRSGLTHEDVLQAIRERERTSFEEVRFAVLEVDGQITVVPKSV